ncbi:acyl-CoA dehydrogenase family protein [Rhodococcus sp. G-MC3]|uniref:acyl-CoA dehydrogenase family protein n=1 Tax=Rhodococcus sp. G-MC3 TaxID=3046209 RepID=UPI0024BA726C|nr:acyl-CoA dehydrogenase family protein [Rhodococcus sp. G-MC3]MDJ0394154.1 acyl-CoA dehydrogenase family protein [Rhodococcus sp. G-MC3]
MSVLDGDQEMLADSLRALLKKYSPPGSVRLAMESPDRFDRRLWAALCEQIGAGGMSIPEQHGGAGGGSVEAMIVAEELGRVLTPSPALGSSGIAAALILESDDVDVRNRILPAIASGQSIVSVCSAAPDGDWTGGSALVDAVYKDGWSLTGRSHYVLDAASADTFLVAASSGEGVRIFEVSARSPAVTCSDGAAMDPTRALYTVTFDDASGVPVPFGDADTALDDAVDWGRILLAGEQVGAAAQCLESTIEYSKSRIQFGRPIGSFQALKHRMADLHVLVRTARATAYSAARAHDTSTRWRDEAAIAAVYCSEAFAAVAADCVQLHGGIAITWEHDMQLYFKRAHASSLLFGSASRQLGRLEHAAGLFGPDHRAPNQVLG